MGSPGWKNGKESEDNYKGVHIDRVARGDRDHSVVDGEPYGGREMTWFCTDRHQGLINGIFLDFTARKIELKELWTLRWHRSCDISKACDQCKP